MATSKRAGGPKPVGYGCPPEQHQVKPKEVRNPWGRKGKPRPEVDFMDELFGLRFDGQTLKVPRSKALDYALFQEALKGNVSAAKELARRQLDRENRALAAKANAGDDAPSTEDEAALDRYIQRRLQDHVAADDSAAEEHCEPGFQK